MRRRAFVKPLTFAAGCLPLAFLIHAAATGGLGANPPEAIILATGEWTLRLLLITLAVTPLRRITGWRWPGRIRRMLGLFTFAYALLHFTAYALFEHSLSPAAIGADILERPFIALGLAAFLGLLALAATSTTAAMVRLGPWWIRLHRSVYVLAVLAVIHFYLEVKADIREPLIYGAILAGLLGFRALPRRLQGRWLPPWPPPRPPARA